MGRTPCCDSTGLKKGPWTPEEDYKLVDYIQKNGHGNWRNLPKNAGLQRCGKSCRLRWTNYLRPDIKRGKFSFEEEEAIIQLHRVLGNKWSAIATRLPERTDNEIKNYWNTHIRKRLLRMGMDPVTHSPCLDLLDLSAILRSTLYSSSQMKVSSLLGVQPLVNPELLKLAASLMSSEHKSPSFSPQNSSLTIQFPHEQQLVEPTGSEFNDEWLSGLILPSCLNLDANFELLGYDYHGLDHQELAPTLSSVVGKNKNLCSPYSSSPTQMNSNSTNFTSAAEDEKESYCSQILNFEIHDIFDEAFM